MKVLIVGGAGYIGSHMALMLGQQGADVVVLDDLSSGHADAVLSARLVQGSIEDTGLLDRLFADESFDGVMHFASFIQVGESVQHPAKYYRNNVIHTINLLDAMVRHRVKNFIFSSTAAMGNRNMLPSTRRTRSSRSIPTAAPNGWSSRCCKTMTALMGSNRFACATSTLPEPIPKPASEKRMTLRPISSRCCCKLPPAVVSRRKYLATITTLPMAPVFEIIFMFSI